MCDIMKMYTFTCYSLPHIKMGMHVLYQVGTNEAEHAQCKQLMAKISIQRKSKSCWICHTTTICCNVDKVGSVATE
jgi:hypothetical protein